MSKPKFGIEERQNADSLITMAFAEDLLANGDITSIATIPETLPGTGFIVARQAGVIAGLPILDRLASVFDRRVQCMLLREDGSRVERGALLARLSGMERNLLELERTALNFLQRLSGIATLTARYVEKVKGTKAVILDTRKTTPGWRRLEKYAVRCGGGRNHRMGLYDAVLIKDNHLAALQKSGSADPIGDAINAARMKSPTGTIVEVEVDSLEQLDRALTCLPDIVLVDNLGPDALAEAVRRRNEGAPSVLLEASGGVNLETVAALARSGVDRISVGALTHSAPALDLALDYASSEDS
jgi:nicotinate-nucleotide pyrophosphorylase (carboxylating)